jgi:hypothetical protein
MSTPAIPNSYATNMQQTFQSIWHIAIVHLTLTWRRVLTARPFPPFSSWPTLSYDLLWRRGSFDHDATISWP